MLKDTLKGLGRRIGLSGKPKVQTPPETKEKTDPKQLRFDALTTDYFDLKGKLEKADETGDDLLPGAPGKVKTDSAPMQELPIHRTVSTMDATGSDEVEITRDSTGLGLLFGNTKTQFKENTATGTLTVTEECDNANSGKVHSETVLDLNGKKLLRENTRIERPSMFAQTVMANALPPLGGAALGAYWGSIGDDPASGLNLKLKGTEHQKFKN